MNNKPVDIKKYSFLKEYEKLSFVGNVDLLDSNTFTIVGSRKCTHYGRKVTQNVCEKMTTYNITTVSGLVQGIDNEVFLQTLKNGGSTIACLGYGFDYFFKNTVSKLFKNKKLLKIFNEDFSKSSDFFKFLIDSEKVLFLSQFDNHQLPAPWTFPKRDNLLASAGRGTLVVEAGKKSGTFYTVKKAFKEGKKVFCVPNSIFSHQSVGSHKIIVEGFKNNKGELFYRFNQILDYLNVKSPSEKTGKQKSISLSDSEKIILHNLSAGSLHFDDLLKSSGLNLEVDELSRILTKMEIKGLVEKDSNSMYVRK